SYFQLERRSLSVAGLTAPQTPGDLVLGPLFSDVTSGSALTIITPADPLKTQEFATVSANARLWGAEMNVRSRYVTFYRSPIDYFVGFRYLALEDGLDVASGLDVPGRFQSAFVDSFTVRNRFYGGQVGASFDLNDGPFSFTLIGKLAMGGVET